VVDDRLRPGRLWAQMRKAKRAAQVARGTLHSFRRFFVNTTANAGVWPFKVMKLVGHSSLDIISTYYHVSAEELLAAVDGVDFAAVLGGRPGRGARSGQLSADRPRRAAAAGV
jgi:integrase